MQALRKLSIEHGPAVLRAGGMLAALQVGAARHGARAPRSEARGCCAGAFSARIHSPEPPAARPLAAARALSSPSSPAHSQFVDFYTTDAQRVAVSTAAALCAAVSASTAPLVAEASPT